MKEGDGIALFRFERVRTEPIAVPVPPPNLYTQKKGVAKLYDSQKHILIKDYAI